jgi:hypothetical protein
LVALAFATFVAFAFVVALVAFAVFAALFVVTFVSLAFVVAFAAVILVALAFVATALVGTAFFGRTVFLAAEVTFFTAMLDPFKMNFVVPTKHERVCVRIRPSAAVLNGETPLRFRLVHGWTPKVGHQPGQVARSGAPTIAVRAPLAPLLAGQPAECDQPCLPSPLALVCSSSRN